MIYIISRFWRLLTFSMLLENGSDLLQEDGEGCGPLHHAAREGYVQVAGKLLELGAKVQFFMYGGREGHFLDLDLRS